MEDIKKAIEAVLRERFIATIYKCYKKGTPYEEIPQKCWDATWGTSNRFMKRRIELYTKYGGKINDIFPISVSPPSEASFKRPITMVNFERMKLIFELFIRWFYTWEDSPQWIKLHGK